ncbi:glycoside hydrolase family 19 protein [Terrihabitans rhizophilus]|uniref:Glycoside hydrolase family 19 protein n=1 Tax=Terrihabitans rhizophilus TaxID=3092662 RepID=A0ABU4RQ37_9HYPH|nr:glycoside hydrolase family 19 protein [Terrihabitans sp. PJ23]MDX6806293.1 glycoside hydrolase family 19 protein [Terrihabitans sp. PJ23]
MNAAFFNAVRTPLFGGQMTQEQVDGCNALFAEWERGRYGSDPRQLTNVFAQVFHETGRRMVPVREGFAETDIGARKVVARRKYGKADPKTGHVYYGRGQIQLTWADNYLRLGQLLGIDLLNNPDLALDCTTGARIAIRGMVDGLFTGKKLSDYFNDTVDDPRQARRIVNKMDKADVIAGYHAKFLPAVKKALAASSKPAVKMPEPIVARIEVEPATVKVIQQLLRDKGWPEVGEVDGKMGERTSDTIAAAANHYGWQPSGLDDTLIANLVRAPKREVAESRAKATAQDLKGSKSVRQGINLSDVGIGTIGLGSIGGLAQVASGLTDGAGQLKTLIDTVLSIPWWVPCLAVGGFMLWRGYRFVKAQVEAYREGRHV